MRQEPFYISKFLWSLPLLFLRNMQKTSINDKMQPLHIIMIRPPSIHFSHKNRRLNVFYAILPSHFNELHTTNTIEKLVYCQLHNAAPCIRVYEFLLVVSASRNQVAGYPTKLELEDADFQFVIIYQPFFSFF